MFLFRMEDEGLGTAVVLVGLAVIVGLAIRSVVKTKKEGKSLQCGMDCSKCGRKCH